MALTSATFPAGEAEKESARTRCSGRLRDVRSTQRDIVRFQEGSPQRAVDHLVTEEPLELRIADTPIAVVMRTPGDDADLALGFTLTEGVLLEPDELTGVTEIGENRLRLDLARGVRVDPEQFRRNLYTTSSCGVCGKASIDAVRITASKVVTEIPITAHVLAELPRRLLVEQETFLDTGGLHAAALFDFEGRLIEAREDIGRHNAVDKVVGAAARRSWPFGAMVLFVTGRISFEIVQKAAVVGISCVAGISAASSLAVDLARELGVTVVGFVRNKGFNLYTGLVG
ncbi:MAG: formate dehydrogenase accessory sulfurtransferase FdhD [Gammaproteobacteria bacterium]|nr:formate dehydrogenase accessory sulfurtransferase FdhD [Gammaproteobacteria bacterium]